MTTTPSPRPNLVESLISSYFASTVRTHLQKCQKACTSHPATTRLLECKRAIP